jgi:hypothetical protein
MASLARTPHKSLVTAFYSTRNFAKSTDTMKQQRHTAIREVLNQSAVPSQDELRRRLARHPRASSLQRPGRLLAAQCAPRGGRRQPARHPRGARQLRPRSPPGHEPAGSHHHHRQRSTRRRRHRLRRLARSRWHDRGRRYRPHHLPGRAPGPHPQSTHRGFYWLMKLAEPVENRPSHRELIQR